MVALARSDDPPTQAEFHAAIPARADRWYSACLRITRDRDLAQDAVQDALLSAWHKRHQYERSAQLDTWIHRIAVNAALQLIRKQRPAIWQPVPDDIVDDSPGPFASRVDQELDDELGTAMKWLSDIERTCFVLKHIEQWRLQEIASELDLTIGTIKQALFRAVKKLRVHMADLRSAS
jgi:RNA polymerase sigma-70 factor (ECF subfamily)